MIKNFTLILFVLLSISAYSQNITIIGTAPGQVDQLVRVIVYSDQFSNLEKTIAETKTNNTGEFSLEFNVENSQFAFLALNMDKGEFYITPGSSYNINIIIDTASQKGSIFDKLPLNFTVDANDGGVTQAIGDFNIAYNDFIYNNINSIYKSRDKSIVMKFVNENREKLMDEKSKYVFNYIEYSLAQLLWLSKKENNQQILSNYFVNKPFLYNNIQYTEFFKEFFKSFFSSAKIYSYEELILAINSKESIDVMDNLLTRNEILATDRRVREVVEMILLSRNYHNRDVNKKLALSKFNDIANSSNYTENRLIANNYIVKLQELQHGTLAPDFTATDIIDTTVSLSDFKGEFVLLDFVKEDCRICEFHLELINDIQQQSGNKFEIITIYTGNKFSSLVNFARERGYKWTILKASNNILMLEAYNIRAYPSYILINPDGTIAYAHLPMPDENMELYLNRFISSYNNRIK